MGRQVKDITTHTHKRARARTLNAKRIYHHHKKMCGFRGCFVIVFFGFVSVYYTRIVCMVCIFSAISFSQLCLFTSSGEHYYDFLHSCLFVNVAFVLRLATWLRSLWSLDRFTDSQLCAPAHVWLCACVSIRCTYYRRVRTHNLQFYLDFVAYISFLAPSPFKRTRSLARHSLLPPRSQFICLVIALDGFV